MAALKTLSPPRSSGLLASWALLHVSTAIAALGRLARHPFASLMTILVIAVTLALPSAMHLLIKNAQSVSATWDSALDFSIYLQADTSINDARRLADLIQQRADVEQVTLISSDEALAEFRDQSGFGEALDHLTVNPLPHTLVVRPGSAGTAVMISLLHEELGNLPEADIVQVDTEWVRRFHAILDILQRSIAIGAALLGAAIIVIIGNTIRLDIQNRREEIEVTKLIGASNAFVRRPFLWTGFWYGLLGGLLAIALVQYGVYLLQPPLARLAGLYQSGVDVRTFELREIGIIIGIGVFLGLVGSWFAAARHMRRIEPR